MDIQENIVKKCEYKFTHFFYYVKIYFMNYIKGKFKQFIFSADSGYKVGLFRVIETNDENIEVNKTITFTGFFAEVNHDDVYILYGDYIFHNRYGYQFNTKNYEKCIPEGKDAIIDFLTSSFVKGCGETTAKSIYKVFGDSTLDKIKENKDNLFLVPKMSEKKANSIYNSVIKYFDADEYIIELKEMGFSMKETMNLINSFGKGVISLINDNIYFLKDMIDFKKLDNIFLLKYDSEDERRVKACIIEAMKNLSFRNGDIYLDKIEIVEELSSSYKIFCNIDEYLKELYDEKEIMIQNEDYYLMTDYLDELNIAKCVSSLILKPGYKINKFNELIKEVEKDLKIKYNNEQKNAIKMALTNNISVITGGPGTGKTTIIRGILKMYQLINKLSNRGLNLNVQLLAPTGRAAKRMSETCEINSSTIHRFLKWDKENNAFGINELNKLHYNLIIVDETSMIDNHLLSSLFRGIDLNTQIIFVGDEYQLPSVGPGLILNDLIDTKIPHIRLERIYRQSDNSYISLLAKNIRDVNIKEDILEKKDDYNFILSDSKDIKSLIKQMLDKIINKGLNESNIQILAPMYKGENGIDNLNILLQNVFNPADEKKHEIKIGNILYRECDKILNLVNDVDLNIYNGDIGYIEEINIDSKTDFMIINYYGNKVSYKRDMMQSITHAYAISIHKSQGSEFDHVIMPITMNYSRMLYNKLLYTGVSRAKKSLVIIGDYDAFLRSVNNNFSYIRKTSLKNKIMNNLKDLG